MAIGTIPPHLRGRVVVDDFGEGAMGLHGCVSGASRIAHKGVSVIQCADGGLYQPTPTRRRVPGSMWSRSRLGCIADAPCRRGRCQISSVFIASVGKGKRLLQDVPPQDSEDEDSDDYGGEQQLYQPYSEPAAEQWLDQHVAAVVASAET